MNGAHFHLVVNHLPIIFPLVGALVMVTGILSKSEPVKRTAFMIFIIGALTSIVAMTTGERAEDVVEKISGVTESYIESHEEIAETFAYLSYFLGGISLLGLWAGFKRKNLANMMSIAALLLVVPLLILAKQTGTTGGEIRHTEIRDRDSIPVLENKSGKEDD